MPVCSCNTCMSGCTCINNGNNAMAIMQWVLLPALATHSTRLVCVAHTTVCSVAMLPYLLSVRAAVVVARVPGRPGIGGRTNRAARVSTHKCTYTHTQTHAHVRIHRHTQTHAHVRVDTHANTQTHKHTHVAIPCVLVVPCAACRPCHCLSSLSLPFVHPALHTPPCAALPCCHACSPSAPRWCCVGRAAWRCRQSLMMTQIDGWTRGVVKTRKGWPITPFRESGNGNWLIFGSLINSIGVGCSAALFTNVLSCSHSPRCYHHHPHCRTG